MRGWALALVMIGCGSTDDNQFTPASVTSLTDGQVWLALQTANQGEVDAGSVAAARATDPSVVAFAQRMVSEHSAALQRLSAIAITPADSDVNQRFLTFNQATAQLLQNAASGSSFDRTYVCSQLRAHTELLNAIDERFTSLQNPQLAAEVGMERVAVQSHLASAQQLAQRLGGASDNTAACASFGGAVNTSGAVPTGSTGTPTNNTPQSQKSHPIYRSNEEINGGASALRR